MTTKKPEKTSTLRIIAGQWRGRKLPFLPLPGLRPTPDRIRETLFNWLAPIIRDSRCLDLFAGSGALGIEALSRGAQAVVIVDHANAALRQIQSYLQTLDAHLLNSDRVKFYQAVVPLELSSIPLDKKFDIVFLDPPFHQGLIAPCCEWLEQHDGLAPNATIYLEAERDLDPLPIPNNWTIIRSKKAGQVGYHLARRQK